MIDMTGMFPYIVAFGLTALLVLLGVLIYFAINKNRNTASYDEQLEELLQDDQSSGASTKITLLSRWNNHWNKVLKGAGMARYDGDDNSAGRDMALISIGIMAIVTVVLGNVLIGIAIPVVIMFGSSMLLKMKSNKKEQELNIQLPGFLFSLKANLQASDTTERAMLKVIESMPSPLYDDLVIVKHRLLANGTFREALTELSEKTNSRDLKFLSACMIQASLSGANMVLQIDKIQKVLEDRRKVADEIDKATKTVQPAIWLSTAVIPALFLASYFMDASSRSFWFVHPLSWAAIIATIILYVAGMLITKGQVDKIKNM